MSWIASIEGHSHPSGSEAQMIDDLDGSSSTLRLLAWQALRSYPTDSLLRLLDDDDYVVRTAVARELQTRSGSDVYQWAIDKVTSERIASREIAAFILGQLGTPELPFRATSIPALMRLASDNDTEVRSAAIAGLGHLRADEAVDIIIAASQDSSNLVRGCAVAALGHLTSSAAVISALRDRLRDDDATVREWAASELEDLAR